MCRCFRHPECPLAPPAGGHVPCTVTAPGCWPASILAPNAMRHRMVEATSAPLERPVTWAVPRAIAFKIRARCEMDLSPGTERAPPRRDGRLTVWCNLLYLCHPSVGHELEVRGSSTYELSASVVPDSRWTRPNQLSLFAVRVLQILKEAPLHIHSLPPHKHLPHGLTER